MLHLDFWGAGRGDVVVGEPVQMIITKLMTPRVGLQASVL